MVLGLRINKRLTPAMRVARGWRFLLYQVRIPSDSSETPSADSITHATTIKQSSTAILSVPQLRTHFRPDATRDGFMAATRMSESAAPAFALAPLPFSLDLACPLPLSSKAATTPWPFPVA